MKKSQLKGKRVNVMNSLHDLEKLEATEIAQKVNINWSIEGDENSKYFHGMLNKKRNQHAIHGFLSEGIWIEEPNSVKNEFLSHFKERFDSPCSSRLLLDRVFPNRLSVEQNLDLERNMTNEEIKRAVWDCDTDKSPGPDGFTFVFIEDIEILLKKMLLRRCLFSLHQVHFLKVILANRLVGVLGDLVNEVQSAFIVNIQILYGPFISDELIHWCKSNKKETVIFKVDFEKAYDLVRWDYLDDVLNKFGFGSKWRVWIHNCLNSYKGLILVNGSPTGEFYFQKDKEKQKQESMVVGTILVSQGAALDGKIETKDILSTCSNSKEQQMQQIQDKAKESCMVSFQLLHSHLKPLLNIDSNGTQIGGGFERSFIALFDQDNETFTSTLLLNLDQLEKQLDKEEFQETGSVDAFGALVTQFHTFINFRYHFDDVEGAMICKFFQAHMESVKKSIDERAQHKQEYDSRVNDTDADNRGKGIKPIYDEEPMAKVQTPAKINVFVTRQQHTELPEFNNEGEIDQNAEQDIRRKNFSGADPKENKMSWFEWSRVLASKDKRGFIRVVHDNSGGIEMRSKISYSSIWSSIVDEVNKLRNKGIDLLSYMNKNVGNGLDTNFWEDARDGVEMEQFRLLTLAIEGVVSPDMNDRWFWSLEGSGEFSVASARKFIDDNRLLGPPQKTRWINVVDSYEEWLTWILSLRISSKQKDMLEGIYYVTWWLVWNHQNKSIFDSKSPSKAIIFDDLVSRSFYWCRYRCKARFSWLEWMKNPNLFSL
nr:RNA-directed DNA polymerase, eukaryota, reverse transcriptase zinc-binding domain protein [Tanacetum cinerariifolium]